MPTSSRAGWTPRSGRGAFRVAGRTACEKSRSRCWRRRSSPAGGGPARAPRGATAPCAAGGGATRRRAADQTREDPPAGGWVVLSPLTGVVSEVFATAGDAVAEGDVLMLIE